MYNTVFIIYLEYAKDFHLFSFFLLRTFLLVKNTCKISYNRNPVKIFRLYNKNNLNSIQCTSGYTGTVLGSSLHSVEAQFIWKDPSSSFNTIIKYFIFLIRVFFTSTKYA
jgi:hypothetical protein